MPNAVKLAVYVKDPDGVPTVHDVEDPAVTAADVIS